MTTEGPNPRLAHLLNNSKFAKLVISGATPAEAPEHVEAWMKQRAVRDSLFLQTTLYRENGMAMGEARVRNLSSSGLMAECKITLRAGDRIAMNLRGVGEVIGRVAWSKGTRIGVAFDREIDPRLARKPVINDPSKDIPYYVRYLGGRSGLPPRRV